MTEEPNQLISTLTQHRLDDAKSSAQTTLKDARTKFGSVFVKAAEGAMMASMGRTPKHTQQTAKMILGVIGGVFGLADITVKNLNAGDRLRSTEANAAQFAAQLEARAVTSTETPVPALPPGPSITSRGVNPAAPVGNAFSGAAAGSPPVAPQASPTTPGVNPMGLGKLAAGPSFL